MVHTDQAGRGLGAQPHSHSNSLQEAGRLQKAGLPLLPHVASCPPLSSSLVSFPEQEAGPSECGQKPRRVAALQAEQRQFSPFNCGNLVFLTYSTLSLERAMKWRSYFFPGGAVGGVRQILEGGDWRLGRKKLCTFPGERLGGVRQILEGGDWRLGRKKLSTDIFRAWELSKQGHSGAGSLCLHPTLKGQWATGRRAWGNARQGGCSGLQGKGSQQEQRALRPPPSPPHPFRLLPRFISQADVRATQQLCGMNSGAQLPVGPPPAPVP